MKPPMNPDEHGYGSQAAGSLRQELARALGLGELLVLAALVALAPVLRLEDAYVPVVKYQPHDVAGEGYFLWLVAILGALAAVRIVLAGRFRLPEPAAVAALAGWTLFVALRGAAGDHPFEARNQAVMWLGHLVLFAVVLAAASGKGGVRHLLFAAVVAGLVLESLRTVWQARVELPALHEEIRAGLPLAGLDLDSPVAVSRLFSTEPTTSFLSSNLLAAWLAMAALAGAGLFAGFVAAEVSRPTGRSPERAVDIGFIGLAALGLFGWAFLLTGSKGAWLAAFGAVAGTLVASPPAAAARNRRWLRLIGGGALALALAAALAYRAKPDLPGRAGLAASVDVRLGYWRAAATMAGEHPVLGVGPGTFGARYPRLKGPLAEESQSAHCAWIETAAESGLVGLALLAGFWALLLWRLWRRSGLAPNSLPEGERPGPEGAARLREAAALVFVAGAGAMLAFGWLRFGQEDIGRFLGMMQEAKAGAKDAPTAWKLLAAFFALRLVSFPLFWSAAFALAVWPLLLGRDGAERPAAERWLVWGVAAGLAALLLHAGMDMDMGMRALVGSALIIAALALAGPGGREWRLDGRRALIGAAALAALAVAAFWCGAREYRRGGALAALKAEPPKELAGRPFERAAWYVEQLQTAVDAEPLDYHLRMRLANAGNLARNLAPRPELARDFLARTEAELRRAVELAPARTTPRRVLGHWLLLENRCPEAAAVFREASELYPLKAQILLEWGDAELLAGRVPNARERYRQALATSRQVSDEAIHLSVLFEAPAQMNWEAPRLDALAAALEEAVKAGPGDGALFLRRGLVEIARGQPPAALDWLRRAAGANPRDAQLALFEGYGLRLAGEPAKALERMRQAGAIEKLPDALSAGPYAVSVAITRTEDAISRAAGRGEPGAGHQEGSGQ
jgi:tetratricopeptide (TPR) repeat protein/O-antigen ligase